MPIVRISLPKTTLDHAQHIGQCVYQAMRDTIGIPEGDNFQVISQHEPGELVYDPSFYGIERSAGFMIIEVTLARGRAPEVKQRFYHRITELLSAECSVRPEDVMITLFEIGPGDFSLGEGKAQFLENLPPHLQELGAQPSEAPTN
ncbi:tautomerase family protein [Nocardioides immobilis]|uniref:Tautomerase family protein n=1 Tax=Nocardioides immobilis TaxID=2049295 RepID=A0A417Y9E0_9ACTN|nr:tautomerase family protein [Nocardioides immobilis]RHW29117.1 tautomerase family protein [Nocardioides immobilis]